LSLKQKFGLLDSRTTSWPGNQTHSFLGFCNFCIASGSHCMTNHDFFNGKAIVV
jgi:hypothetical protein